MFRRFQGKILVAIFVYRVQLVGGDTFTYTVPPNYSNPDIPALPINLELADISNSPPWTTAWDASGDPVILGSPSNTYDPVAHDDEAWQEPPQWLLDQNNNIHRVLSLTPSIRRLPLAQWAWRTSSPTSGTSPSKSSSTSTVIRTPTGSPRS